MSDHSFKIGDIVYLSSLKNPHYLIVVGHFRGGVISEAPGPYLSCIFFKDAPVQVTVHHSALQRENPAPKAMVL